MRTESPSGRSLAFRGLRSALYGVVIPLLRHTGPLEPLMLRGYRRLTDRDVFTDELPCPVRVDGLELWHDRGSASLTVRALALGTYEPLVVDAFRTILREGMTVLDVGAHIGYHTLVAARLVGPHGRVWSFEPDPENRRTLEKNVEANGFGERVSVVSAAAGSRNGQATLHRNGRDTGSSTLFERDGYSGERVPVTVMTLDAWAAEQGWPPVDLVKLDVEGADAAVLEGMVELCKRNPKMVVILEFQADALEAAGSVPELVFERLRDLGLGDITLLDPRRSRTLEGVSIGRVVRMSRWVPLNLMGRRPVNHPAEIAPSVATVAR